LASADNGAIRVQIFRIGARVCATFAKTLNDALDKVRKTEYARLEGKDRRYVKGQKYVLLRNHENLSALLVAVPKVMACADDTIRRYPA